MCVCVCVYILYDAPILYLIYIYSYCGIITHCFMDFDDILKIILNI